MPIKVRFAPKADIRFTLRHVCLVPGADSCSAAKGGAIRSPRRYPRIRTRRDVGGAAAGPTWRRRLGHAGARRWGRRAARPAARHGNGGATLLAHGHRYHRRHCGWPNVQWRRDRRRGYHTLVEIAHRSLRVRHGVRDQGITRWCHHEVMAAGHDDQILLTILLIDDRRGLAAGGEHVTPQDLAGLDVDRLDQIVGRRRDEDQAARRHDRSSVIGGTDLERNEGWYAERTVPPGRTKRTIPQRFAGGEIDRADAAIRRSCAEHAGRHLPSRVDEDAIGRSRLRTRAFGTRGASG